MAGMQTPDWANDPEMRKKLAEGLGDQPVASGFRVTSLIKVTEYSTFFAEWMARDDTLLVHLFPRAGAKDTWDEGFYLPKCRNCGSEVPLDQAQTRKPCPQCSHVGLVYVPGNRELRGETKFPKDVLTKVKTAVDQAWYDDVAIEWVSELGAVAVQFQDVNLDDDAVIKVMEAFFDAFDAEMEKSNGEPRTE